VNNYKQSIGKWGEKVALLELQKIGYTILETNFSSYYGEIDIIAKDPSGIIFIEVKTRSSNKYGYGIEAISKTKQKHLINTTHYYLKQKKIYNTPYRIDVATLEKQMNGVWKFRLFQAAVQMF
jgi:putative endonuclease